MGMGMGVRGSVLGWGSGVGCDGAVRTCFGEGAGARGIMEALVKCDTRDMNDSRGRDDDLIYIPIFISS